MKYLLLKQSGAQAFKCYLPVFRCTPSLQSLPSVASWTGIYTSPQTKLIHFFFSLYLFANTFSILWLDEPFTCFAPRSNHSFSVSLSHSLSLRFTEETGCNNFRRYVQRYRIQDKIREWRNAIRHFIIFTTMHIRAGIVLVSSCLSNHVSRKGNPEACTLQASSSLHVEG